MVGTFLQNAPISAFKPEDLTCKSEILLLLCKCEYAMRFLFS